MLFEIFEAVYPNLSGDRIRGHLEESWRGDHAEEDWREVCDEILFAWDEWRYAWDNYPRALHD